MKFLSVVPLLLLIPVLLAQDSGTPPGMILFDITTQSSGPSAIASAFSGTQVLFKYQVIGHRRFFVLVVDDGSDAFFNLTLPSDATQVRTFPVEKFGDFLRHFGVDWQVPNKIPPPGNDLTFVERDWNYGDLTMDQERAVFRDIGTKLVPPNTHLPFILKAMASNPHKGFYVWNGPVDDIAQFYLNSSVLRGAVSLFGGPGSLTRSLQRIKSF